MAEIYNNIESLYEKSQLLLKYGRYKKIVCTSGGFDPLHVGHLRCIQESAKFAHDNYGALVVIVNGDGFLTRKKGKPFMSHEERMEIVAGIQGVDYVTGWDDGTQTVIGALELLRPSFFMKGGDRSESLVVPEFEICKQLNCIVKFGIGGSEKIQSSSKLINSAQLNLGLNQK